MQGLWKYNGKGYYKGSYAVHGDRYDVRWFRDGRTEIYITARSKWPASEQRTRKNMINVFRERFGIKPEITVVTGGSKVRGADYYANGITWYCRFKDRPDDMDFEGLIAAAEDRMVEMIFVRHAEDGGIEEYRYDDISRAWRSQVKTECEKNGRCGQGKVTWTIK